MDAASGSLPPVSPNFHRRVLISGGGGRQRPNRGDEAARLIFPVTIGGAARDRGRFGARLVCPKDRAEGGVFWGLPNKVLGHLHFRAATRDQFLPFCALYDNLLGTKVF
jgi:hypothetical protein